MVDNLLPDHVGLTHVFDLAVHIHLVHLSPWIGRGGVCLRHFPFQNFIPSWFKVLGGVGHGGPCDYCVTPVPIGLEFWTALGLGVGLRGPDLGLGLDNFVLRPLTLL